MAHQWLGHASAFNAHASALAFNALAAPSTAFFARPQHSRVVGAPTHQQQDAHASSLFANPFLPVPQRQTGTVRRSTGPAPTPVRSIFAQGGSPFGGALPFMLGGAASPFATGGSTFDSPQRRELSTSTMSAAPRSAAATSPAEEAELFADLRAAQDAQASEEIENDSDNTLHEDLRLLEEEPTLRSAADDQVRQIAASFMPTMGRMSVAPRARSPPRRMPNLQDALAMPPQQLVHGFTSTDAELDAAARLAKHQAREYAEAEGRDLEEDEDESESTEPLINEIVGWLTESNQAGSRGKEKQRLMDMPHDIVGFFRDTGRAQDLPNWNTLLRVCAAKGMYEQGMTHWEHMRQIGLQADPRTYVALITLCSQPTADTTVNAERLARAWSFLEEYKAAFNGRVEEALFHVLVVAGGKLGGVDEAFKALDSMKAHQVQPTHMIYTELINVCRRSRTHDGFVRAEKLFNLMRKHGGAIEPDTMAYNCMIRTAGEASSAETAIALFDEMRAKHYAPDAYTYASLIHACSKSTSSYALTFEYFTDFLAQGFRPSVRIYNTLLHACARNSDVANALSLWALMDQAQLAKDTVSYSTMLNVLANSMKVDEVRRTVPKKDDAIVTGPTEPRDEKAEMKALAKEDKLDKEERIEMARKLFLQMKETKVPVTLRTINAMVKVMAVAGRLQRVLQLQSGLFATHPQFSPDFHSYKMIFTMYLEACRYQLALDQLDVMHEAGLKGTRGMYSSMLRKLAKPHKKLSAAQLEGFGQAVLAHMAKDGVAIDPKDERFFNPELYRAHAAQTEAQRVARDTVKSGPAASYSQREDAMIRTAKNRTGSGRLGHQSQRFAEDPKLAVYKAKRAQREADAKDKAQGLKPKQRREHQESIGHYYPTAQQQALPRRPAA